MALRDLLVLAAAGVALLAARPVAAVKPCPEACHLRQGQPVLLVDRGEVWVRTCEEAGSSSKCVLSLLDMEGRERARVGQHDLGERPFAEKYFKGHKLAQLGYQAARADLRKPLALTPAGSPLSLRVDGTSLVCTAATETRRPLGCVPTTAHVFAAGIGQDSKPADPSGVVVVVATCNTGAGTREVAAVCRARP
jgi:hypothetical protein